MEEILVTGAHGLVGSHLVPLLAAGRRVHAVARGAAAESAPNVVPLAADLSQPFAPGLLPETLDGVVWLAQSSRFRDFPEGAADMFAVNLAQLQAVLDHARRAGAKSFVYASTGSVYAPSDAPLTEESATGAPGALGYYAASRLAAELLVATYAPLMNVAILRFFFVYGRGQKRDMLIPRLVDSVREGRPVALQGESGLRLDPLNARDAAAACEAALGLTGFHIVNVAGPEPLSIRDICDRAGQALGTAPRYQIDEGAAAPAMTADIARMERLLGAPQVRFDEGVLDLV